MTDDKKVKKLGMKDIQRENWEYELTVSLLLDRDTHTAIASKDRTELFEGKDPFVITEATGKTIRKWCETGVEAVKEPAKSNGLPTNNQAADFYEVWQAEVTAMDSIAKLSDLYNAHVATVNEDEKIKAMFSKRTAELRPKKQTA